MPQNVGFTLEMMNQNGGYVHLFPQTQQHQVENWTMGQMFGPYNLTLTAAGWSNGQQTIALPEMVNTDIPYCVKMLSGTEQEMIEQDRGYSRLDPLTGIESLNGQVRFTCTNSSRVPAVDINVQVYWTR